MKFDSYSFTARLLPGLITALPLFVLHFFFLSPVLGQFWGELLGLKLVADLTFPLVFLYLLMQLSRFVAKELFEKRMFGNGLETPTCNMLLHGDECFSPAYRAKIHRRIMQDFGIAIPAARMQTSDRIQSRKIVSEAISHIRAKVGKGVLLNQHNAEYGFYRNLAGGAVFALVFAMVDTVIFGVIRPIPVAAYISIALTAGYLLYLAGAKRMIRAASCDYARILIQEYMSQPGEARAFSRSLR